jgi:uncharacterized protein (TIGR01777 family)
MPNRQLSFLTQLSASAAETFDWHNRQGAFLRLTPPWEHVRLERQGALRDGERTVIRLRMFPGYWKKWVAEHAECIVGRQFCDDQIEGPFKFWEHLHQFEPTGPDTCTLEDRIEFALPGGALGAMLLEGPIVRSIARMFAYRQRQTRDDLHDHHQYQERPRMKVLISGATGLVGSALSAFLSTGGHTPVRLNRPSGATDGAHWDPDRGIAPPHEFEGFDAVIHLAGENVAGGRWTAARKRRIVESRVPPTRILCETLAKLKSPPKVLLCASAVGYYGDRGDELLDESSPRGAGFLADACVDWEAACEPARAAGIRVCNMRLGVVLAGNGGALPNMLPPFKLGLGGEIAGGKHWMAWVAIDDVVGAFHHALMTDSLSGPVNVVAPRAVTNTEFTKTLGHVLRRPTIFAMPRFVARTIFGEMADELLLASQHVVPQRLQETRYEFRFPNLEGALRHVLGRLEKK